MSWIDKTSKIKMRTLPLIQHLPLTIRLSSRLHSLLVSKRVAGLPPHTVYWEVRTCGVSLLSPCQRGIVEFISFKKYHG